MLTMIGAPIRVHLFARLPCALSYARFVPFDPMFALSVFDLLLAASRSSRSFVISIVLLFSASVRLAIGRTGSFSVVRLDDFEDKDFLRHAGEFIERVADAAGAHVDHVVALVGMLRVGELNSHPAYRLECLSATHAFG